MKRLLIFIPLLLASCGDWFEMPGTRGSGDQRVPSNLTKADFNQLPGWKDDDLRYALKSFKNSCKGKMTFEGKVVPDRELFEEKCRYAPSESADLATVRKWFEEHFQAYRVNDPESGAKGRMTGYYSPTIPASRTRRGEYTEPLMAMPTDGREFKGVDKKTILAQGIGKPLYWAHPVDVQNLQIQGSGMLRLDDGRLVKLNFASTNDVPFNSPGRQLQDKGITPPNGMAAAAVWEYLKSNPALAREIIDGNPRYVYFSEAGSFDVIGKLGVPLQKIRSVAVDDSIYALGVPMFIDTQLRDGTRFQKLVVAQDRGEAIKGWVRADIFFGIDAEAEHFASGQNYQGSKFVLLPKKYSGGR